MALVAGLTLLYELSRFLTDNIYLQIGARWQHFITELDNGITITWTPDGSTDVLTPDTVLPENDQLDVHNILVHPIEEHEQEIGTVLYPEEDLAEYIVTFPADAGLPPLYLMFQKTARDESGVVTGKGEDITGIWLEKASEGLGSPVPSQIADKLRGKEFSSFDAFRKAFWIEVSKGLCCLNRWN